MARSRLASLSTLLLAAASLAQSTDVARLAQSVDRFGAALYAKAGAQPGNFTIAPGSIALALSMTAVGARGATLDEIGKLLWPAGIGEKDAHAAAAALGAALLEGGKDARITLANDLWAQRGHPLLPEFQRVMRDTYHAGAHEVEFEAAREEARKAINAHVARATNDRIKELLLERDVPPQTLLILTNAIWLRLKWQQPFKLDETRRRPFALAGGEKADVPMMHRTGQHELAETDDVQVLQLPYRDCEHYLEVLLPRAGKELAAAEALLVPEARARLAFGKVAVSVTLPKFTVSAASRLREPLIALGMPTAFGSHADFSGVDGGAGRLVIGDVVHQAWIKVDEEGTEAAAATAVIRKRGSDARANVIEFRADRPFVFALRERTSGCALFVGRVVDPR